MKVEICDVCATEGKIVRATHKTGFTGLGGKSAICPAHRSHFEGMDRPTYIKEALRLAENVKI